MGCVSLEKLVPSQDSKSGAARLTGDVGGEVHHPVDLQHQKRVERGAFPGLRRPVVGDIFAEERDEAQGGAAAHDCKGCGDVQGHSQFRHGAGEELEVQREDGKFGEVHPVVVEVV